MRRKRDDPKGKKDQEPDGTTPARETPVRHIEYPSGVMPMGVDVTLDVSGNPSFKPNANTGGPGSTSNIGGQSASRSAERQPEERRNTEGDMAEQVTDPVCGMTIDKKDAVATSEYQGQTYYFCAESCRAQFDREPGRYTAGRRAAG